MGIERKFIEGHSYKEIYRNTRAFNFEELKLAKETMDEYLKESQDINIPVCIRQKPGDTAVKRYDKQTGLDPRDYYGDVKDIEFVTNNALQSRIAIAKRFFEGDIKNFPQKPLEEFDVVSLLNLKEYMLDLEDKHWVYLSVDEDDSGSKFLIYEVITQELVKNINNHTLSQKRDKNNFLQMYGNYTTDSIEREKVENFVNHFRPAKNVLRDIIESIDSL